MPNLHASLVTLRISGDHLVPDEITSLLGANPTHAHIKGETSIGRRTRISIVRKSGTWQLSASDREPADIDGQIQEILRKTSDNLKVWKHIGERYHIDLFCGLFFDRDGEGITVSAQSLEALSARGIDLALIIYTGDERVEHKEKETVKKRKEKANGSHAQKRID
jgi:hypothetical protein